MTLTVENKTVGLALTPVSPLTLTVNEAVPVQVTISNGPALNLAVAVPNVVTLQMPTGQGISGVYGSSEYTVRLEQINAAEFYRGEAEPGSPEASSVWRIQKLTITGSSTTVLWAGGSKNFANKWTDRTSLSYT